MLPLFPVRVRRHVSALGTRKLEFVEVLRELFQDRTGRGCCSHVRLLCNCVADKSGASPRLRLRAPPPPPQLRFKETQLRWSGPNNGRTSTWWGLQTRVKTTASTLNLCLELESIKCDVINRKLRHFVCPLLADCSIKLPPPHNF